MITAHERLVRDYRRAERAIKRYELLIGVTPTPAVQQLRYAGHHLSQYLLRLDEWADGLASPESEKGSDEEFRKARHHAKRAWYDAFDGLIIEQLDIVREFQQRKHPKDTIRSIYPEYDDDRAFVQTVASLLAGGHLAQQSTTFKLIARIHANKKMKSVCDRMVEAGNVLDGARAKQENIKLQYRIKSNVWSSALAFVSTVLGSVLTIHSIVLADWHWGVKAASVLLSVVACATLARFILRGYDKTDLESLLSSCEINKENR